MRGIVVLSIGSAALGTSLGAFALTYVVKDGDSLSKIVGRRLPGPVWGNRGRLKKVLALNPSIENPDRIFPGEKIDLSVVERKIANEAAERPSPSPPSSPPSAALSVTADFFSTRLSSLDRGNGTRATLLSRSSSGFALEYAQLWSPSFSSEFYFGERSVSFSIPQSSVSLETDRAKLYSFGMRGNWRWSEKAVLSLGLGSASGVFLRAISVNRITLDTVSTPALDASLAFTFLRSDPLSLGGRIGASISSPTSAESYRTDWNPAFGGSVFVDHRVSRDWDTETGLLFRREALGSTIVDQNETDYGIYLRLRWRFPDRKPEAGE